MDLPYIYQLQEASYETLVEQHFSVAVVDMDDTGMSRAQVEAIEAQDKTLITYVSIGEAEDYRDYWDRMSADGIPDYVLDENDDWEGNYRVEFWQPEWQALMAERIEEAVALGYSGAYLDIVDAYTVASVQARFKGEDIRAAMQDFVISLSEHAKALDPDFLIVPQNAVGLLGETEDTPERPNVPYLAAIDGVGVEDLWYDDDRPSPWTEGDLEFLRTALDAGKFVIATSYPTETANQRAFIAGALSEGLLPFVGTRPLDGTFSDIEIAPVDGYPLTWPGGLAPNSVIDLTDLAFLTPRLRFADSRAVIALTRNDVAFADVATTPNARESADGVESLGLGNALFDTLVTQDTATANRAFGQLAGEVHPATLTALAQESLQLQSLMQSRLTRLDTTETTTSGTHVWTQGWGSRSEIDDASFDMHSKGLVVGVDAATGTGWQVGALIGTGEGRLSMDDFDARTELDHTHLGAYARHRFGDNELRLGAAYTYSDADSRRRVRFADFDDTLEADFDAETLNAFAELSRHFTLSTATLSPFAGVSVVSARIDDIHEHGGPAALTLDGERETSSYAQLGLRHWQTLGLDRVTLRSEIVWQRRLDDDVPELSARFDGGDAFTVESTNAARDQLQVGAGVGVALTRDVSLDVGYAGRFGDDLTDHGGNAALTWRF
ncbi:autotransporter domain-containing protein [Kushneria aurantia]|uniref:Autotransporter domain-containing protein n=1 Tax=Kushneria aurantia TaxID=504092 RepID=A0ABV6FZB4_9GAMM|nr:autotransporter domain-containing protein [Kushneria aurantia]